MDHIPKNAENNKNELSIRVFSELFEFHQTNFYLNFRQFSGHSVRKAEFKNHFKNYFLEKFLKIFLFWSLFSIFYNFTKFIFYFSRMT